MGLLVTVGALVGVSDGDGLGAADSVGLLVAITSRVTAAVPFDLF